MESSSSVWSDYENLRHNIKHNTVDKLKQILNGLNEECGTIFVKSGKKQEIIDRIIVQLESWRREKNEEKWVKAKAVLYQVKTSGIYTPSRPAYHGLHVNPATANPFLSQLSSGSLNASSPTAKYDPYASVRKPSMSGSTSTSRTIPPRIAIKFKPSPFFEIDQAVSSIVECPMLQENSERQQHFLSFTLLNDQVEKLQRPNSDYQLRLFCTSSTFYTPNSIRVPTSPCLIEFPPTCEVRFNNALVTANTKGLKKKPGTAPPANLGKAYRVGIPNRVDVVYVNTQPTNQPTSMPPVVLKKFYLTVMLVQVTGVDQLVERLVKGKYRALEDVRQKMRDMASDDDEIVAGPQKMSLKCPLSFTRIDTPSRSSQCVHSQCFDATSWFSIMEQATTWLCPVCERVLDPDDLIIDGYFDDILTQCPEEVEEVMVEADGEWHTTDNKYASATWKSQHPSTAKRSPTPRIKSPSRTPTQLLNGDSQQNGPKAKDVEVFVLDSDEDEDEGRVKRELSPPTSGSASANQSFDTAKTSQSRLAGLIDLTIDSDDDERQQPPAKAKRKASDESMSPTEQIWKKNRIDHEPTRARTPSAPAANAPVSLFHSLPQRPVTHPSALPHSTYPTYSSPISYNPRASFRVNSSGHHRSWHAYNRNGHTPR